MTTKEKKRSTWKESIETKVKNANFNADLLQKVKRREKLNPEETRQARKVMRENSLILDRLNDVDQMISTLKDRAIVYQAKLDSHERRKEFRRDNACFELFRGKFYRRLRGDKVIEHNVPKTQVCEYWDTMWNRKEDEDSAYEEYLYDCIPQQTEGESVFPSYEEFTDIVKWLPSWKAAGCDGVYNFFIKKCTPIHPYLYRLIRETCMGNLKGEQ